MGDISPKYYNTGRTYVHVYIVAVFVYSIAKSITSKKAKNNEENSDIIYNKKCILCAS